MSDGWLGFVGGVVAALVGGLIASMIQRHNEAKRRKEDAQLETYFHLLELNQWYFWIATAELHGEHPDKEILAKCREISGRLADKLRAFDDVERIEEILTILFSSSIATANERARRLDRLLHQYGALINPKYARAIRKISDENVLSQGFGKQPTNNAPGSWRYVK